MDEETKVSPTLIASGGAFVTGGIWNALTYRLSEMLRHGLSRRATKAQAQDDYVASGQQALDQRSCMSMLGLEVKTKLNTIQSIMRTKINSRANVSLKSANDPAMKKEVIGVIYEGFYTPSVAMIDSFIAQHRQYLDARIFPKTDQIMNGDIEFLRSAWKEDVSANLDALKALIHAKADKTLNDANEVIKKHIPDATEDHLQQLIGQTLITSLVSVVDNGIENLKNNLDTIIQEQIVGKKRLEPATGEDEDATAEDEGPIQD